ncbi:MAG: response regulator [Anaerolineae bacterium]|nr:response regulator [Anaerolineae bacterium]
MTHTAKKVILVADDDAMNREIMEAFLSAEDYEVILANDGTSALRQAKTVQPDLIILDVKMPDMTGYDVCKKLRRDAATRDVAVMIVTGFDAKEDREEALQAGANVFFPRPFGGDDLITQVSRLLQD